MEDITISTVQSNLVRILIECDNLDAHRVAEQRLQDSKHLFGVRTHLGVMIICPKGAYRSCGI